MEPEDSSLSGAEGTCHTMTYSLHGESLGKMPCELEGASEHHIQTRPSAWGWRLCIGVGVQMSVSEFVCAMYAYAGRASHAPGWKPILNALAAWAPNLTPLHFQIQRRPRSGDDLAKDGSVLCGPLVELVDILDRATHRHADATLLEFEDSAAIQDAPSISFS